MGKYSAIRKASDKRGERNDCAVVAVSIAGRVPYNKAHDALRLAGRKNRKGTQRWQTKAALETIGCTYEVTEAPRQPNGSRYTAKTIGNGFKRGFYLVFYRGHVAAMVNGKIEDWTDDRNHRVQEVWKITVPRGSRS